MPRVYCLTFAICLGALLSVNAIPVPSFDPAGPATMCNGASIGFESKMRHIAEIPPVDIMLFGNSRIIAVGTEEIGLPGVTVFNTGSGGTSFRQSVTVLEQVLAAGKAPKVAVLSFDNVTLAYAQNGIDWPPAPARWAITLRDILALPTAPHRIRADLRSYNLGLLDQEISFTAKLANIKLLWPRLMVIFGQEHPCQKGYRPDGSRPWSAPPKADLGGGPLPPYAVTEARYPLLEHDLDRLKSMQDRGVNIVVYESPLLPAMTEAIEPLLTEEHRTQRRRLMEGCIERRLRCHRAPVLAGNPADGYWNDTNHAPAPALGRFIADLARPLLAP
ncbi:hypothetical protein [Paramagnetospirillum magnetotacticum]|uniref:hypothetical protein n=1 Tax=Paramagnetospirillum magnetotacticum TaxID=188 RepID=UPI0009E6556F|nr:hypothetical protein [Paramagnetospirillum magnetotacticum]